ncbi:MAG TPA: WYL domain-containing protein [Segeticoccus sp.]|uniref:helix-turn-helix transcriptional regulator n=1 Tax=Segeticoccus sp. TaxID=2706531 RepID=UPI002D7F3735|nr:WYL domain-containing protein [Segeticoccus sp.]HET8598946.1 WYL domain-containing protein [Segeticoccus sp.]
MASRTDGGRRAAHNSDKTERLLNLVICLLYTRRPLSKAKIRDAVPQYAQTASVEAFDRMFERDKDELRDLGIPLITEAADVLFDDEPGYRIDRREYALPDISFEPDELAVLGLASRTWHRASLGAPAAQALRKLEAAGVERDDASIVGLEPRVRTAEPAFDAVKQAVVGRYPIRFDYRAARSGERTTRHVQPWGIASWHGRWYLTGFDTDRDAERVFRLGRIEGKVARDGKPGSYEVPAGHDPRPMIDQMAQERPPQPAAVRVRRGAGHTLRRRATLVRDLDADWSQVGLDFNDVEIFADELASFGPDVVVLEPTELVDAVVRRLTGVLRAESTPESGVESRPQSTAEPGTEVNA